MTVDCLKRIMTRGRTRGLAAAVCLSAAVSAGGGCSNAGQGAVSGAGIGALSGLAIGSMTGSAGTGAAIGAIAGGVGGAVIGDQNRRRDEATAAAAAQQPQAGPPPGGGTVVVTSPAPTVYVVPGQPYSTGQALGRLVGQWRITGTIDVGGGANLPVTGSARGTIDKNYFVRLDCTFNDPRTGATVEGTSYVSQSGGTGVRMSNSFSSSPEFRLYKGEMDPSGNVFNLTQFEPPVGRRKIVIRMSAGRDWTTEVSDDGRRVETYTFTWIGV